MIYNTLIQGSVVLVFVLLLALGADQHPLTIFCGQPDLQEIQKEKNQRPKISSKDTNGKLHSGNGYCMVLSCIDTIEMILSDWRNIGTEPSENLKNFYYKTPNLRASAEVE